MKEQSIKNILQSKIINQSELVRRINRKGLSVPSLYNKMNPEHPHKFKQGDLEDIEKELKKIANLILSEFAD